MNSNLLKGKLAENNLTIEKVSKELDISANAFSCKLRNKKQFKIDEVKKLQEILFLTDEELLNIFLR